MMKISEAIAKVIDKFVEEPFEASLGAAIALFILGGAVAGVIEMIKMVLE